MRTVTLVAAGIVVACVAALTVDYVIARGRAPGDERRVTALQQQVRTDASLAPKLEAEQKRIAEALRARKKRINWLAVVLIVASAVFVTGAKRMVACERPSRPLPAGRGSDRPRSEPRPAGSGLSTVEQIVAREGRGREAAIPILQAIQGEYRYLPEEALQRVCEITDITPAQISGTSSFYSRFRRAPVGEHIVRVCHGTACHVAGARQITEELRRGLGIPEGSDTDPSRQFTVEEVACLGCCSLAPVMMVDERTVGKLKASGACDALV